MSYNDYINYDIMFKVILVLDDKSLKILKTINIYKNISKAADKLYTAQPNLSRLLKNIEKNFGYDIFNRSTSPMTLTKEGEILFEYINKFEKLENEMYEEINNLSNSNKIRIGALTFMTQYIIPDIIPEFISKFPSLDLTLTKYSSVSFENALLNNEIDLFITNREIKNKNLKSKYILDDPIYLMYPKSENVKNKTNLLDFKDETFYLLKPWKNLRKSVEEIFKDNDLKPKNTEIVSSIMNGVSLTKAKKGVTFIYGTSKSMIGSTDVCDFIEIKENHARITIVYKNPDLENLINELGDILKTYIISILK